MNKESIEGVQFSHLGLCVSDLELSIEFYCNALGFERIDQFEMGDEIARITEVAPPLHLRAEFLRRGNFVLELLDWATPSAHGSLDRRAMNTFGLTHLGFVVNDIDVAIARVRKFGGIVIDATRTLIPEGDHIYCTDPNGVRIELVVLADPGWFAKVH